MTARLLLAPLLFCLSGVAQDPAAYLEGEVRDGSGVAVADAAVTIRNFDTGYQQSLTTSAEGFYKFALVPTGRYQLSVERSQFARYQQQPVQLNVKPDGAD